MPRIMTGLHPGAAGDVEGKGPVLELKMSGNMLFVFFMGLIGFNLLFVWMLDLRVRAEKLDHSHILKQSK